MQNDEVSSLLPSHLSKKTVPGSAKLDLRIPRDARTRSLKPGQRYDGGGLQAESFLAARFRPLLFWPRPIAFANSDRALA